METLKLAAERQKLDSIKAKELMDAATNKSSFLYLCGRAGTGKTTLANALLKHRCTKPLVVPSSNTNKELIWTAAKLELDNLGNNFDGIHVMETHTNDMSPSQLHAMSTHNPVRFSYRGWLPKFVTKRLQNIKGCSIRRNYRKPSRSEISVSLKLPETVILTGNEWTGFATEATPGCIPFYH